MLLGRLFHWEMVIWLKAHWHVLQSLGPGTSWNDCKWILKISLDGRKQVYAYMVHFPIKGKEEIGHTVVQKTTTILELFWKATLGIWLRDGMGYVPAFSSTSIPSWAQFSLMSLWSMMAHFPSFEVDHHVLLFFCTFHIQAWCNVVLCHAGSVSNSSTQHFRVF